MSIPVKLSFFLFCYFLSHHFAQAQVADTIQILTALNNFQLATTDDLNKFSHEIDVQRQSLNDEQVIPFYEKALTVSLTIKNDSLAQRFVGHLTQIYIRQRKFPLAEKYGKQGLEYAEHSKVPKQIANAHSLLGSIYTLNNNITQGLQHFLKVIEIEKEANQITKNTSAAYSNLSYCFYALGEFEQSIRYLRLVEQKWKRRSEKLAYYSLINVYYGLTECYNTIDQLDSAKTTLQQLEQTVEKLARDTTANKLEHDYAIGNTYANLTSFYLEWNQLKEAELFYQKYLNAKYVDERQRQIVDLQYAVKTNQLAQAKVLIEQLPETVEQDPFMCGIVADYYQKINDYEKSLYYTNKSKEAKIATLKSQRIKSSAYAKSRIDAAEYQAQFDNLAKEQAFRRKINGLGVGFIILLTILLAALYYAYRQIRVKNEYLQQNLKNREIIAQQNQKIQQNEQQKNKLFTNIAHELQTPLNIIQGLSQQTLKKERLSASGNEAQQIILKNSTYLSEAAQQILTLSMPNQKVNALSATAKVRFSFSQLLDYILPEFQFLAQQKDITIITPTNETEAIIIHSEVEKITTILKNLLSNAIKHTATNGRITIEYDGTDGEHHISVRDNGKGIAVTELPTLFDRYYQSPQQEAMGGFGLGLAICREYIQTLGGMITVESELGEGSIFTIHFPKTVTTNTATNDLYQFPQNNFVTTAIADTPTHKTEQILIVEDNIDFCKYLELTLKDDYYLIFKHNGQQALAYLQEHQPALIMTDWMMPEMDGATFIQHLKASDNLRHLPVLMLTARSLISDELKMLRLGIDDYLVKPIDAQILQKRINHVLTLRQDQQDFFSIFATTDSFATDIQLSANEQNWLLTIEAVIRPLISDFDLTLDKIANLTDTNVKQLNRKLKAYTGLTAKKYVQEIRFWEARQMLEDKTYDSVKAVCYSVGFKDLKYFSRRFKERFGQYPSEYL